MWKHIIGGAVVTGIATLVPTGFAQAADPTTYSLDCRGTTYTVVKGNENAASYTDGKRNFITAIGNLKTAGNAQSRAVPCTINGFGPIPFIVTPAR